MLFPQVSAMKSMVLWLNPSMDNSLPLSTVCAGTWRWCLEKSDVCLTSGDNLGQIWSTVSIPFPVQGNLQIRFQTCHAPLRR